MYSSIHSFIHSFIYSLILPFIYHSFIITLTHEVPNDLNGPRKVLTPKEIFIHFFICSLILLSFSEFIHLLFTTFIISLIYEFIYHFQLEIAALSIQIDSLTDDVLMYCHSVNTLTPRLLGHLECDLRTLSFNLSLNICLFGWQKLFFSWSYFILQIFRGQADSLFSGWKYITY